MFYVNTGTTISWILPRRVTNVWGRWSLFGALGFPHDPLLFLETMFLKNVQYGFISPHLCELIISRQQYISHRNRETFYLYFRQFCWKWRKVCNSSNRRISVQRREWASVREVLLLDRTWWRTDKFCSLAPSSWVPWSRISPVWKIPDWSCRNIPQQRQRLDNKLLPSRNTWKLKTLHGLNLYNSVQIFSMAQM